MAEFARRSSRVLVVDAAGRVLLIRFGSGPGKPARADIWLTPGGGVEPGEELAATAARELAEETGIRVAAADLTLVAYTEGHADLGWARGLFRDEFFLHRVVTAQVDTAGLTAFERTRFTGHRWWTPAELAASTEKIHPFGLAELVADLTAGQLPAAPVALPWHH
jgi:8-oxo-dGTP pyrophosphatase MutT (NUDIX family)